MLIELKANDEENATEIIMKQECETWYSALDFFVKFLRAGGYNLTDESVGINTAAGHIICDDDWYPNITTFEK